MMFNDSCLFRGLKLKNDDNDVVEQRRHVGLVLVTALMSQRICSKQKGKKMKF